MNYKLLLILAAVSLIFVGCAKDELTEQPQPRVMRFTATVEEPADTRATLEETDAGAIRFKWKTTDIIQMAFVQGTTKKNANAAVTSVSEDGRTAQFSVKVPDKITGDFILYAYRSSRYDSYTGGSELLATDPTIAVLPMMPSTYTATLYGQSMPISVWCKKDITYSGGVLPDVSLAFQHLGAMMTVKVKNSTGVEVNDIFRIRLKGTKYWVWNYAGNGMAQFNMAIGSYVTGEEMKNIALEISTNMTWYGGIAAGAEKTYYTWFVPGAYTEGNAIALEAIDSSWNDIGTTGPSGSKNQIDFQPGNNYRVAIEITGTSPNYKLNFVPW
ncbi:hypothetical protein [Phocaeicola oris]|uniref:hypothetical protein n=1 Tax=Phocaeicola oris TaxID=2896850 RepID=UPI00234F5E82|nr:hypothetical protein [Phocaeicola oris]MCE2615586.1 fimbrillin family protein [Phocaeicola oris]